MNCPCKDCEDRCIGCHSNYEKYKNWREEYTFEKNKQKEFLDQGYYSRSARSQRAVSHSRLKRWTNPKGCYRYDK